MKAKLDDQMAVITRLVSQNRKLSSKNRAEEEESKNKELQCKNNCSAKTAMRN